MLHRDDDEAVRWLNSVLDLDPRNADAHRRLADYYAGRADDSPEFSELARQHRTAIDQARNAEPVN